MATRGIAHDVKFIAWDTSANAGKTGDAANITMRWIKSTTSAALTTTTVTEVDSTNCPGVYRVALSATETDTDIGTLAGKSSTANISIIPVTIQFERLPDAAPTAAGGVLDTTRINGVATTSVTTINANIGTTQPVNYTGTGASALVKSDMVDIAGAAVSTSSAQIGVNAVNIGGTAQTGGDIYSYLTTNIGLLGANLSAIPKTGFKLASDGLAAVTAWTVAITGNITGNLSGSVGSVTGNVGGNVTGSVGSVTGNVGGSVASVTAGVTVTANNDKTGYSLSGTLTTLDSLWTKIKNWLGAIAGKTADNATLLEIQATTAGTSFDNTTDSLQAQRDNYTAPLDATATQSAAAAALTAYDPPTRTEATSDKAEILTRLGTPAGADIATDIANVQAGTLSAAAKARIDRSAAAIALCTVGSGSTTTSIVTSDCRPSGAVADQFVGRIVIFDKDTTTAALRGQATDITASSNSATPTLTVTALTTAPSSGDTFTIT